MENIISPVYWIFPNIAYKVNDHEIIGKIRAPEVKQKDIGWQSILGGILALFLANLLKPLVNYFDVMIMVLLISFLTVGVGLATVKFIGDEKGVV